MDQLTQINLVDIPEKDRNEDYFLSLLAEQKWQNGFVCRKCGHTHYCKGKKPFSRRCTKCKTEESATAHTIFHHCKMPLKEAFELARMVCLQPEVSSYELSRTMDRRQMTCWKFKTKIMECLESPDKVSVLRAFLAFELAGKTEAEQQ